MAAVTYDQGGVLYDNPGFTYDQALVPVTPFPAGPLPVLVQLSVGGTWTDITDHVYVEDGVSITRGQQDEGSDTEPSTCSLTLNNRDGRFSPRNPTGPYYGMIGRNTPIRLYAAIGQARMIAETAGSYARATDSAGLSVTGDIDLRFTGRTSYSWLAPTITLISKNDGAGLFSYGLVLENGYIAVYWSADGTTINRLASTIPVQHIKGALGIRAAFNVNIAGSKLVTFYTSDGTPTGTWSTLGGPVTTAGTTSIFDSTSGVAVGLANLFLECYTAEIRQGVGGTVVANPDFTGLATGTTSFADTAGTTWTLQGDAVISNYRQRFIGEVSAWPPKWDLSGKDVRTPIEAAGILRRLGQGASPFQSPFRRYELGLGATLLGYWPMEDAEGSTSLASAVALGKAASISGTPALASDSRFVTSSPLPDLQGAVFTAPVRAYTPGATGVQVRFLGYATGATDALDVRVATTGDYNFVFEYAAAGGTVKLSWYDSSGTLVGANGPFLVPAGFTTTGLLVSIELKQNGTGIDTNVSFLAPGASGGSTFGVVTAATSTLGRVSGVTIKPTGPGVTATVGHLTVENGITTIFDRISVLDGYAGEHCGTRFARLCTEQNVAYLFGAADPLSTLGVQPQATFVDLIAETINREPGILIERRDTANPYLEFRSRQSLYNQVAGATLVYGDLVELGPTDDDQNTRNDVTVTRSSGSSSRFTLDAGSLSTQAPPLGVGTYDLSVDVNTERDDQLPDQASWRVHLGTVDEARYPGIQMALHSPPFTSSMLKTTQVADLDQGDLLTVTGLPVWLPPESVQQIVLGLRETFDQYSWVVEVNCAPAAPYRVLRLDDSTLGRLDAEASRLQVAATSTATAIAVSNLDGLAWVTTASNPGEFPFDIVVAGERMTVTAISGTGLQTFTVTRSVNGVVKAHSVAETVRLFQPSYIAL